MKGVLAYTVEGRPVGDTKTMRAHAVAVCGTCGGEHALTMPHNANNPEAIGERFRREGFEFNAFKRSSVRCPACIEKARTVRSANARPASNQVTAMSQRPTLVANPPGGASPAPVTPEQRAKVRTLLMGTFDEQRGHYLDAYTDQRVAKECGVPVQVVREMREMWLGPIKSVPELDGLASEIAALVERATQHAAEGNVIAGEAIKLRERLRETRLQLGLAA